MKPGLIYTLIFTLTFVTITGAIIFLNTKFKNIFEFDFSPAGETAKTESLPLENETPVNTEQTPAYQQHNNLKPEKDTVFVEITKDSLLLDSMRVVEDLYLDSIKNLIQQNRIAERKLKKEEVEEGNKSDYSAWLKDTAKLYESMDAGKAAKIIQNYSDSVARDVLYTMKKKKAAEILAELNPDTATRITRAN